MGDPAQIATHACGNGIVGRCHQNIKRIAARKQCTVAEVVYRYNATPRDYVSVALVNVIHSYRVWIEGIDGVCLLSRREMRSPYRIGYPIWVKPPNSQCASNLKNWRVTGVVSEQSVSVNVTTRHVKDLRPALETIPLASDSENHLKVTDKACILGD